MSASVKDTFSVLIADDSEDDRILLKSSMRRATRLQIAYEASDGKEVISYFKGNAGFRDRKKFPLPDLLLLDLKMPQIDGFGVLEWLGKQSHENLLVVVLTDSMQPEYLKKALDLGADLFQVKPRGNAERETMILALQDLLLHSATSSPIRHLPTSLNLD